MKIQFSDTNWATEKIIKLFKRNSDRSLSAVFRRFRKSPFLDLIGDYPLLFHIVDTASSFGINFSRQKLLYAFNQSNELSKLPKGEKFFAEPAFGTVI